MVGKRLNLRKVSPAIKGLTCQRIKLSYFHSTGQSLKTISQRFLRTVNFCGEIRLTCLRNFVGGFSAENKITRGKGSRRETFRPSLFLSGPLSKQRVEVDKYPRLKMMYGPGKLLRDDKTIDIIYQQTDNGLGSPPSFEGRKGSSTWGYFSQYVLSLHMW